MQRETLTIKQIQEILNISESTVFRYIRKGDLKGFKMGKEWRFEPSDIDDFIQRRRQVTAQQLQDKEAQPC